MYSGLLYGGEAYVPLGRNSRLLPLWVRIQSLGLGADTFCL